MKLVDTNLCHFGLTQEETLNHLFLDCEKVKPLIQNIKFNINEIYPNLEISNIDILLGYDENDFKLYNYFSNAI